MTDGIAGLLIGQKTLGAGCRPLDRTAEQTRGDQYDDALRMRRTAQAEPAAHVLRHHIELVFGDTQCCSDLGAQAGDPLGHRVEGVVIACRVVVAIDRARLERVADHPVVVEREPHHSGGAGEDGRCCRLIALAEVHHPIARHILMQLGRAFQQGVFGQYDGREVFVVNHDGFERVLSEQGRVGDDACHDLTDKAHGALCEHRTIRLQERLPVTPVHGKLGGQRTGACGAHIVTGEDGVDTLACFRRSHVNADNACMRPIGAQEGCMQLPRQRAIRGVQTVPSRQTTVFKSAPEGISMSIHERDPPEQKRGLLGYQRPVSASQDDAHKRSDLR